MTKSLLLIAALTLTGCAQTSVQVSSNIPGLAGALAPTLTRIAPKPVCFSGQSGVVRSNASLKKDNRGKATESFDFSAKCQ
jgi:hypothetical protein